MGNRNSTILNEDVPQIAPSINEDVPQIAPSINEDVPQIPPSIDEDSSFDYSSDFDSYKDDSECDSSECGCGDEHEIRLSCSLSDSWDECRLLTTIGNGHTIVCDNLALLTSLKMGHIHCCRAAIENVKNPRTLEISTLFLDGERSIKRLQALELLLQFNFPLDLEEICELHNISPFCDEIIQFFRNRGISLISRRFTNTKSANN